MLERHSVRWSWRRRAEAFDEEMERERLDVLRTRQRETVERQYAVGVALADKGTAGLEHLDVKAIDAQDAAKLIHEGFFHQRQGAGLPTGNQPRVESTAVVDGHGRVGLRIEISGDDVEDIVV